VIPEVGASTFEKPIAVALVGLSHFAKEIVLPYNDQKHLLNEFQKRFYFVVRDIFMIGFVVDGEHEYGIFRHIKMCDHPCSSGLTFTLGAYGQTYLVAVIT